MGTVAPGLIGPRESLTRWCMQNTEQQLARSLLIQPCDLQDSAQPDTLQSPSNFQGLPLDKATSKLP